LPDALGEYLGRMIAGPAVAIDALGRHLVWSMETASPNRSHPQEYLQPFLQWLSDASGVSRIALLRLDDGQHPVLEAMGSCPAGLAGKRFSVPENFPQMAERGIILSAGQPLPVAIAPWMGVPPRYLALYRFGLDGYLLFCWPQDPPDEALIGHLIQGAAVMLPVLIDRPLLLAKNQILAMRLDAVLNNVALGVVISDGGSLARINPVAAALLDLEPGAAERAVVIGAMQRLRDGCEIKKALDFDAGVTGDDAEYWILPVTAASRRQVIRRESHAIGDNINPGRIWLFTDVTALWQSEQRLKQLHAQLQTRETELKRYAADLIASRASIKAQALQAVELAEELHLQKQELESSKRESDYLANHDPLTGLNNRRAFRHALQQMIDVARGTQGQVAVLFIDLDKFKAVNDTLGHDSGDQLLKQVAKLLNDALRDTDLLARFGGDEFAIATRIPGSADLAKVTGLAERIRQKLEIPVPAATAEAADQVIQVGATIGIGLYPGDADDIDALFICADRAMYKGKKAGRNRVVMFRDIAAVS
jgi:diguanylate cyclase (GGDEF)-like protein